MTPRKSAPTRYPSNWPEIAYQVKHAASWCCTRCGKFHNPTEGYTLTVHHLDMNPQNCAWWNLAPLCQRCHLHIQAKVIFEQVYMFEHSDWMKPFVAGYTAHLRRLPDDQDYVLQHLKQLLSPETRL